jgi:hypothetical protein
MRTREWVRELLRVLAAGAAERDHDTELADVLNDAIDRLADADHDQAVSASAAEAQKRERPEWQRAVHELAQKANESE